MGRVLGRELTVSVKVQNQTGVGKGLSQIAGYVGASYVNIVARLDVCGSGKKHSATNKRMIENHDCHYRSICPALA